MNVAEAAGVLRERLKDLGGNKFTDSMLRIFLQEAEIYLANMMEPTSLTELEVERDSTRVSRAIRTKTLCFCIMQQLPGTNLGKKSLKQISSQKVII